jgi:eukaryotic-like serine/threonine-protein kinase
MPEPRLDATLDAQQWGRLSRLLDEAFDVADNEREAWLRALHLREPLLAPRLERLLATALADDGPALQEPLAAALARSFPGHGATSAEGGLGRPSAALAGTLQGGAGTAAPPPPMPGQPLGPWRLLRLLGEGGMGEVWLAERADGLYAARAAIKLLRSDLAAQAASQGLAARFVRERELLARLAHPGIARLLDAGVAEGRAYLVLEHVDGAELSTHVRQQQLPVAARVRLLIEVARAVGHAHAQLVVHRDLKPGNVLVTPEGRAKLLDFGVAKLLDEALGDAPGVVFEQLTQLTRQVGQRLTPAYAAPEQLVGAPVGVAADVYALGVMLYELLTGVLPFLPPPGTPPASARAALEHAVLHHEPLRLSRTTLPGDADAATRGPGRPPDFERARGDLEAVAAKALRKAPTERYDSVAALVDDLERWLAHRPVAARQDDRGHRVRLWLRRNAVQTAAAAAVTLSLAAGLAASLWQRDRAEDAARSAERVTAYLGELLASANPDRHQGRLPTVLDLLEQSRAELPRRFGDDPATQARLLEVLLTTYRDLNRYDQAIPLAERLIAHAESSFGADDPRSLDARMALARIYTSQGSPAQVVALTEPLHARWVRRHGEVSLEHANLLYLQAVAYARVGRFADSAAALARARPIVDTLYRPEDFEHLFFENYVHVLRMAEGRFREAEAVLAATEPRWAAADPRYARFVLVLRRNLLAAQRRQGLVPDFEPRARALLAEADRLLGAGNDMSAGLKSELARHHLELGDWAAAAALQRDSARTQAGAGVLHPALRLPREAEALLAEALAALGPQAAAGLPLAGESLAPGVARGSPAQRPAAWAQAAAARLAELAATPAVSGPARVETALALGRVALLAVAAGEADAADALATAGQALDLAQADPLLATHDALASRSELLRAQWLRATGRADQALPRLRERLGGLAEQPEPASLQVASAVWGTQLEMALALEATQADAAEQARAWSEAARRRPSALPTGHGFDALAPGGPARRGLGLF